jgi:hypothetical protein
LLIRVDVPVQVNPEVAVQATENVLVICWVGRREEIQAEDLMQGSGTSNSN